MTEQAPDLAALVSARLCHDLISPMGAIGNGLELLQMAEGRHAGPELALVTDSLATALAKLRFYRVAFGPADAEGRISVDETDLITRNMFPGRLTASWTTESRDLPRPLVKLVFLALLCLEKSLPMGGKVRIAARPEQVTMSVEGRRTAAPAELWAHVTDGATLPQLRSDGIQFALLRQHLVAHGAELSARIEESAAELALAVPNLTPA
jgi:histidine phosphotransferase ChpT